LNALALVYCDMTMKSILQIPSV